MIENKNEPFIKFSKTGSITDYLIYATKKRELEEGNDNAANRRDSTELNQVSREL